MKLIVNEAPAFRAAIESVVNLVEEGTFEIKKDGIHLKAMDPSQISMVSFTMPKTAFLEYNVDDEKKIGIDIRHLANVLSRGKRGEKVEISMEEGRLIIKFYDEKHKRTFKIPLLEMGDGVHKEPKIEFLNYVRIMSDAFKEAIKDAKLISSHVRLILEPDMFMVDVKGDNGDVKAEFEKGSLELVEIKTDHSVKATFPLQYLDDIVKASSGSSEIKINLETDRPLKVEYEVEGAKAVYYLAPRIETE